MNREAFEAWVVNFRSNVILRRFENGEYVSAVTENYFSVWNAALALQAKQPTAYRVIASVNGEVVRDSLEFTRMSEIDERVVRKSYELKIIPLYSSQSKQPNIDIQEAVRETSYVFKDSCDHTKQAIDYMKVLLDIQVAKQPTELRKAKPMSEEDKDLLRNKIYFANDGEERDWSEQEAQAQQEPLKVSENWREPLSADAMQRLKNLGVLDKSPAPEGDKP